MGLPLNLNKNDRFPPEGSIGDFSPHLSFSPSKTIRVSFCTGFVHRVLFVHHEPIVVDRVARKTKGGAFRRHSLVYFRICKGRTSCRFCVRRVGSPRWKNLRPPPLHFFLLIVLFFSLRTKLAVLCRIGILTRPRTG
jgi:hypothetical protein